MSRFQTIFKGVTPEPARRAVAEYAADTKYKTMVVPFCGRFGLVEAIVKARNGQTDNVWTSDMGLYSSTLGYYICDLPLEDLGFQVLDERLRDKMGCYLDKPARSAEYAAAIMLTQKYTQLKRKSAYYYKAGAKEILRNTKRYIDIMVQNIEAMKKQLHGIRYRILDYQAEIDEHLNKKDALIICNTPCVPLGYTHMFTPADVYKWNEPDITEFLPPDDFNRMLAKMKGAKATIVVMKEFHWTVDVEEKWFNVITCFRSTKLNKNWQMIANRGLKPYVFRTAEKTITAQFQCFVDDEVKHGSKVQLVKISKREAAYYRDLLLHKLGSMPGDEEPYVLLIDGKVAMVIGLMTNYFTRRMQDYVFIVYGITVHNRQEPNLRKLVTKLIYSRSFKEDICRMPGIKRALQFRELKYLRSTKIGVTKDLWDMPKSTTVISTIQEDGMFKILYEHAFTSKNYHQLVVEYTDRKKRRREVV